MTYGWLVDNRSNGSWNGSTSEKNAASDRLAKYRARYPESAQMIEQASSQYGFDFPEFEGSGGPKRINCVVALFECAETIRLDKDVCNANIFKTFFSAIPESWERFPKENQAKGIIAALIFAEKRNQRIGYSEMSAYLSSFRKYKDFEKQTCSKSLADAQKIAKQTVAFYPTFLMVVADLRVLPTPPRLTSIA